MALQHQLELLTACGSSSKTLRTQTALQPVQLFCRLWEEGAGAIARVTTAEPLKQLLVRQSPINKQDTRQPLPLESIHNSDVSCWIQACCNWQHHHSTVGGHHCRRLPAAPMHAGNCCLQ